MRALTTVAGVAIGALLLSGCLPQQPTATPPPEATAAPIFASDEEALAAATAAYAAYLAMSDQILKDGGKDPDRNWISLSDDAAWPCAATALSAWHAALAGALGVDPMEMRRSEPLFPAMDRHNNVRLRASGRMLRFDGEAVNELVQNLCGKAGLDANRYGAHSLRAGFVTEALTDNKLTVAEVQEVTHHKTVDVLLGYNRRVNARKSNPTKKLWGRPQAVA